mmetsp:Transcript_2359/g.2740  ORF Transcript_2359/g.2740 Transcript_2359/m.2740 type:complete len:322 (+) Transcript_2359:586-1551(+)
MLQNEDSDALPPREENHPLDTEELPHGVPFLELGFGGVEELDEHVKGVTHGEVEHDGDEDVTVVPRKESLLVHPREFQYHGEDGGKDSDNNVLQHAVLALQHKLGAHAPVGEPHEIHRPVVLAVLRLALLRQLGGQVRLTPQQLDQVVEERRNDVRLVQIPQRVDRQPPIGEPQTQVTLQTVERHHPQDPHHVFLHVGHVPVRQMHEDLVGGDGDGEEHERRRRVEGKVEGPRFRIGESVVEQVRQSDYQEQHCQHCHRVPQPREAFSGDSGAVSSAARVVERLVSMRGGCRGVHLRSRQPVQIQVVAVVTVLLGFISTRL